MPAPQDNYVVRPHDTLYSIAWRHSLDYRDIAEWNHLGADMKLVVGQVLVLAPPVPTAATRTAPPAVGGLHAGAVSGDAAHAGVGRTSAVGGPSGIGSATGAGSADAAGAGGLTWVWPTDRLAAPRPVPGGGILLFGRLGQDVRAARAGRVVYTGNGIRGYGNLVIIRHDDGLLSSYAHNRELLVHEGQNVTLGQVIAHMGTGPHQECVLYFEIRLNGKPADPLHYLKE